MNIAYNNLNRTIQMGSLNIQLPIGKGLYILSSGCGSGKTTSISLIASDSTTESVLIVVPTIDAANELYSKILPSLKTKRMAVLHTGNGAGNVIDRYREDPTVLKDYEILIITAARLIIDPYPLFLAYGNGTRKLVLIDEMINFYPPAFSITDGMIDLVSYIDKKKEPDGKNIMIEGKSYYHHIYGTTEEMEAAYMSSKTVFFGNKVGLALSKIRTLFDHIHVNGIIPFRNRVVDIAKETTVILFDGTADMIFGTDKRVLPITGYRYHSDISFTQYQTPLKRKNGADWDVSNLGYYLSGLSSILKAEPEKSLIVTWKTIDQFPKNNGSADDFEGMPVKYDFPEKLTEYLISDGVPEDRFKVIYRGSGLDRGSNDFRNFANVIFLGEWNIPDNIVKDINNMFECKCKFEDYKKALLVQTICRTRIRQHDGQPIKVFFSSNMDYNLIYDVQKYFKVNSEPSCKIGSLIPPWPKQRYKKPEKKNIIALSRLFGYDPRIRNAIANDTSYSFSIPLDDLFPLIPRDRKAKERYKRLVKFLKSRKLTMTIT